MSSPEARTLSGVDDEELVAIALAGLGPSASRIYRNSYNDFARGRGAASPGAALRELIGLPHDQAEQLLAGYRADLEGRGRTSRVIKSHMAALRRAVRKAREQGLAAPAPEASDTAPIPPPESIRSRLGEKDWRRLSDQAQVEMEAKKPDTIVLLFTIREWPPPNNLRFLEGISITPVSLEDKSALEDALKAEFGFLRLETTAHGVDQTILPDDPGEIVTETPINGERGIRPPDVDPDDELVALALAGLGVGATLNYRNGLLDFARFRRAASRGAALRELIGLAHDRANRLVSDYRADLEARGFAPGTIANRLSILRVAVRRAREAGRTTLALDVDGPRIEQTGGATPPPSPRRAVVAFRWYGTTAP